MASRKHYVALAAILRDELDRGGDRAQVARIAEQFAAILYQDNPRFDRARFLTAALGSYGLPAWVTDHL